MALLNDALMALRRNYQLVLAFLVVALLLSVGNKQLGQVLGLDQENLPPLAGLLGIVLSLATLAVYSATCAIIFARLGKDMDRPIWKCADDSEALRRYFEPWFLLNLVHYAIFRLAGAAENAGQTDLAVSIVLVAC
ncbi:MAG: hypothetical protein IT368_13985, partial [Candidatus Hydrogenedentes bacterium]|nr:hypothetical protein [Candidatus Hydrogenedentota bacterium]